MIYLVIVWSLPFIIILTFQYGVGEQVLIKKNKIYRGGYLFVVFFMVVEVGYCVYLYKFVDYMDFVGLGQLAVASYLFHRFTKRWSLSVPL